MSESISDRFSLDQGRRRPPYKPKDIHCPHCGAGLTLKDERSELVVCNYCSSHINVTEEQAKVLGKGPELQWDFPLKLGDQYRFKGARYEVIARMAFIEDNDASELTREYLLYNPRRGTFYLDEYHGQYSISEPTHVMPKAHPFTKKRGETLFTYDNQKWVVEGSGAYTLEYVDGALPWIAQIGDKITYVEFSEQSGSGRQYEVEAQGDEVEFGMGQAVPLELVRRATGKETLGIEQVAPLDAAQTRRWFLMMILVSGLVMAVNFIFCFLSLSRGSEVLTQSFTAQQITDEVISNPFFVANNGNLIEVTVESSSLDNAWMAVDLAVVEGDDMVIHTFDSDLEYYHGYEGGESWSEGSHSASTYIKIPKSGNYRLLMHAVSNRGDAASADQSEHDLRVKVTDGVLMYHYFLAAGIFALAVLFLLIVGYQKWKEDDDDDD